MGMESQGQNQSVRNLTAKQVKTFQKMEPKALGSIQIIIAVLFLCLSISVLQIYYEVHFTPDLIVMVVVVVQILASGSVLIHSGRFPSLFWVKTTLVVHLVSAAFCTIVLSLLSRHLPYRQDSYHCEHCRRLEIYPVLLLDGLLATLVLFLVVMLVICIVVILFGLSVLVKGGLHLPGVVQETPQQPETPVQSTQEMEAPPRPPAPPRQLTPPQVAILIPAAAQEPEIHPVEDASTPPTEPQVEPIDSIAEVM